MRRADRLFQIIQILRWSSSPITAAAIAAFATLPAFPQTTDVDH
jgi:predicted DNA-binding transcriptional regulator YafY